MRKLTHCILYIILAITIFSTCTEALDSRIKLSPTVAEYVIPYSDSEKIVLQGISELDIKTIEIAKNEIYARHGLVFQSKEMNEYFKKKSWYKADRKYKKGSLNYFEAANVRLLEGILKQPELLTKAKTQKEKSLSETKIQKTSEDHDVLKESVKSESEKLTQEKIRNLVLQSVQAKKEPDKTEPAAISADKTITRVIPDEKPDVKDNAPKSNNTAMNEIDLLIESIRASLKSSDIAQPKEKIKEQVLSSVKNKTRTKTKGDSIVADARSMIGKPYRMGGKDPKTGFDCSGLIWWVYRQNGLETARSTVGLRKDGVKVSPKNMKPGDIVITKNRRGRDSPNGLHAGIYVGGGAMIHSPGRGRKVVQVKLTYHNVLEGRRLTR